MVTTGQTIRCCWKTGFPAIPASASWRKDSAWDSWRLWEESESVSLVAAEEFVFPLSAEENPSILLSGQEFVYAPVVCGGEAGYAYVLLDEKPIGKVALVYEQTVEQEKQPEKKPFWKRWFGGGT